MTAIEAKPSVSFDRQRFTAPAAGICDLQPPIAPAFHPNAILPELDVLLFQLLAQPMREFAAVAAGVGDEHARAFWVGLGMVAVGGCHLALPF